MMCPTAIDGTANQDQSLLGYLLLGDGVLDFIEYLEEIIKGSGNSTHLPDDLQKCKVKKRKPPVSRGLEIFSQRRDSNPRPTVYETVALPAELRWRQFFWTFRFPGSVR